MPGVAITAGSGTVISADTVAAATTPASGERIPYNKLDGGGAGLSAPIENATAANLAAQVSTKSILTTHPGQWSITHAPAVNTQATISKAAGAAGVRHVCTWLAITLANDATGSVQTGILFNLRDGATGAGTILASFTLSLPATAGDCRTLSISGLNIPGTAATAMTLETAGAPASHTAASVAFGGYETPAA